MEQYGEPAAVRERWLAERRSPCGLLWPHTWKRRKKGNGTQMVDEGREITAERSTVRAGVRRAAARDPELSYFPGKRKTPRSERATRKKQATETGVRRQHGEMKRLIRMSEY